MNEPSDLEVASGCVLMVVVVYVGGKLGCKLWGIGSTSRKEIK